MRAMKDSGVPWIGEIPEGWEVCRIKDVAMLYNGNSIKDEEKDNYTNPENTYPYISTKDIDATYLSINYTNGLYTSKDDSTFKIAQKDSCLMCIEGGSAGKKKAYVEQDVSFVNKLCCFAPHKMDGKYLFYYLCSPTFESEFYKYISGLIGGVSVSTLKNFIQLLPPLAEQQKIAEFLDRKCAEVDKMIALQEQIIEELKAYKQSVITEAVTKGLNPSAPMRDSGIEWIREIPEHWEVKRLKNIFRLKTGTTPNGFDIVNEDSEIIPWFTPSDISDDCCELHQSERKLYKSEVGEIELFPKGSLMFVGIGASAGKLGYSHISGYSNQQITALIPDNCNGKYYYYFLIADRKRLRDNAFFTTLPIINNGYLSQNKVVYPPTTEQQAIADYLDEKCADIDSLIQTKQSKIDSLKEYKKSIIYEYVTGKREVE
ncbi:MAG: restriction endonuclease subunit S [Bacteroidales bacterium]|nr:restriction endonuclease subunit S [Bacteroidales bacterium]